MRAWLEGIGLVGPGLKGWSASRPALAGTSPYRREPTEVAASDWLPPAERRRTGTSVRLALAAGREACEHAQRDPRTLATVFTSSGGDGDNQHAICESLATESRDVSPTRFHNSVHNAPAGYWGVATGSMESSTSLCAFDWSFAAGLIEALTWVAVERQAVLLIAYDTPYPEPMNAARSIAAPFGVALLLAPERTERCIAGLEAFIAPDTPATSLAGELETLRIGVPAARCLPLLCTIARALPEQSSAEYLDGTCVRVKVDST